MSDSTIVWLAIAAAVLAIFFAGGRTKPRRYTFARENRLTVHDSRFTVDAHYDCEWGDAAWTIDIKNVTFEKGFMMDEVSFAREFLLVLKEDPIGYGTVTLLKEGKRLGCVRL